MVNGTTAVLEPTFSGYVATTQDALILFEACLTGVLHHVPRRPHDRERSHLVRSGSVFIYEENSSGIKRWTDGVTWSPSRILGNFLVYRELEKPFPPGEKKRAMKKANRRPVPSTRPGEPYPRQDSNGGSYSPSSTAGPYGDRSHQSDVERALVGSLVDSYGFKDSGLVKKTMSVTVSGVTHHLVSYYSVEDVMRGALNPPSMVESLRYIRPRAELTQKQSFRAPIDDLETGTMENPNDPSHALYGYRPQLMAPPGYGMPNPHPEFYMHTAPYTASHAPQTAPISGYSLGASISAQPASNPYLPAPSAPTQIPPKSEDYSHYRAANQVPAQYGTSFDSVNQGSLSSSMPSALNTNLGSSLSERNRSTSDHSVSAYRNSSISSRSVATDMTSPIDPSTPGTYSRGNSFSLSGHMDGTSGQPLEQRGIPAAFDPSIPRRESNPMPTHYYAGSDRPHYYLGATAPAAHTNYPVSTWTTAAPAQPQI
ncbi:camp independent regulatory protein [Aspergillus clavatus NRRL 1]|uniref:Camp independent regulatory protein n=1 Tax=Aspergillus clavatus (strain ATCC 1007 / CBS 513.65 / DSM 816 / NCTC 3887 / NRRL 1 / QM 1276 / 107) TaxID=344612 RepID=A1CM82_ASPCL|nr:camp independent regulatory protein [Aspergillus clavatus NRRL 1]EAW08669.1 camp independent regulatory protein [Aspergillus clavatus NRRL 1]